MEIAFGPDVYSCSAINNDSISASRGDEFLGERVDCEQKLTGTQLSNYAEI